ncbi:MAG: arginine--tRNA ligase [Candidatus Omnitrophota bacterium]
MDEKILELIKKAVKKNKERFDLKEIPLIEIEIPPDSKLGDISTNIALKIARQTRKNLGEIAQTLINDFNAGLRDFALNQDIEKIELKNGFINFFLSRSAYYKILLNIKKEGNRYGRSNTGRRKKVLLEFVSANPTGPLSVAHGRQAALGEGIAGILKFLNFSVQKEYYVNDEGRQIELLGESVKARCMELSQESGFEFPADGYKGQYVYSIAEEMLGKYKKDFLKGKDKTFFSQYAINFILALIESDLELFGVRFDNWFHQSTLSKHAKEEKVLAYLKKQGHIYEKEGAVWFKSSTFGDDKDRVLIKNDGSFTYLTPDIAYHKEKKQRKFEWMINIWGPDHHGYIPRLKAACSALGVKDGVLQVIIAQLCTLLSEGKPLKMSTREGEFVTLRQVIEDVGKDAAKFFFLMRRASSHLDFDLELAKKKSLENPIYYIQYAHARICSIMEFKQEKKIKLNKLDLNYLNEHEELELVRTLRLFPSTLINISRSLEPYTLTLYLRNLAGLFHTFYQKHRVVISDDLELTAARILLIDCTRIVIANGLSLLGISAPRKM